MTDKQVRMVPVEPDANMLVNGREALLPITDAPPSVIRAIYRDMLAAAPSVQPDREVIARVQQMIVDCEAEPDGPLMLSASVSKEHADDLRALLAALTLQKEEG